MAQTWDVPVLFVNYETSNEENAIFRQIFIALVRVFQT